jgi:hypothetical protein
VRDDERRVDLAVQDPLEQRPHVAVRANGRSDSARSLLHAVARVRRPVVVRLHPDGVDAREALKELTDGLRTGRVRARDKDPLAQFLGWFSIGLAGAALE